MKCAIALLGLGLMMLTGCSDSEAGAVVVAKAQSNDGKPCVDQKIFGHFFPADFDFDENEVHYSLNALAKGKPGEATVGGWIVYEPSGFPDDACPDGLRYDVVRFEWGEIYADGSLLRGVADPGQYFCAYGEINVAELTGTIAGGKGRFESASGRWIATQDGGVGGLTGTVEVYCDN